MFEILILFIIVITCVQRAEGLDQNTFPSPSFVSEWRQITSQDGDNSEVEFQHGLKTIPIKVTAEVLVNSNGSEYIFHGTGSSFMDDDVTYKYGQVVYFYNVDMVRIMVPNALTKPGSGLAIYTGKNGWAGPSCVVRYFQTALVRVKVWLLSDFPTPDFTHDWTAISTFDKASYKEIPHDLGEYPDFIVVQVRGLSNYVSEAQGSTSRVDNIRAWANYGGVIYGYSDQHIRIWYPNEHSIHENTMDVGLMVYKDGWGKTINGYGRTKTGEFRIYAWKSFTEISVVIESRVSNTKRIPITADFNNSYVTVEVEALDGVNKGFRFHGIGSTVNDGDLGAYGGLIYAYDQQTLLYWVPSGNTSGHVINIGGIWGSNVNNQSSDNVKVRARVYSMSISVESCTNESKEENKYTTPSYKDKIEELTIDKKSTSKYKRKLQSTYEGRPAAVTLGVIGVLMISSIVLIIIMSDIPTIHIHLRRAYRNIQYFRTITICNRFKIKCW